MTALNALKHDQHRRTAMADKHDDITAANREANEAVNNTGGGSAQKKPENSETVQDVNEAANAEFNGEDDKPGIGNSVGGLRGASD
jgi:hypothetical protein